MKNNLRKKSNFYVSKIRIGKEEHRAQQTGQTHIVLHIRVLGVNDVNQRVVDVILAEAEEEYLANNKDGTTFAAELALLASTLVTAGDFLATFSAAIALRQVYIDQAQDLKDQQEQEAQMKDIQDQITALKNEIKMLRGRK